MRIKTIQWFSASTIKSLKGDLWSGWPKHHLKALQDDLPAYHTGKRDIRAGHFKNWAMPTMTRLTRQWYHGHPIKLSLPQPPHSSGTPFNWITSWSTYKLQSKQELDLQIPLKCQDQPKTKVLHSKATSTAGNKSVTPGSSISTRDWTDMLEVYTPKWMSEVLHGQDHLHHTCRWFTLQGPKEEQSNQVTLAIKIAKLKVTVACEMTKFSWNLQPDHKGFQGWVKH
jgi:hypothetical protein